MGFKIISPCGQELSVGSQLYFIGLPFTTLPFQGENTHVVLGIRIVGCQFKTTTILKGHVKPRERNSAEICNVVAQQGVDHPQNSRLPYPVLAVKKRDAVVQVEIDTMVVNPEQSIDLDALEPEKLMSILLIHCYTSSTLPFLKLSGCLTVLTVLTILAMRPQIVSRIDCARYIGFIADRSPQEPAGRTFAARGSQ